MKRFLSIFFILVSGVLLFGCSDQDDDTTAKFNVLAQTVNKDNKAVENIIVMVEASDDVQWTADVPESGLQWLTLVKNSGMGLGRVIFSLSKNDDIALRSTTITVSGVSKSSGKKFTAPAVTVNQLGSAPSILINPEGNVSLPNDANAEYKVEVTANLEWKAEITTVSGDAGWMSVVSPATTHAGSGEVVLSLAENTTENARIAKLRVVYKDDASTYKELTVNQLRAPAKYNLTIEGMDGTLNVGDVTMIIAPSDGANLTRLGSVAVLSGNTSISYDGALSPGNYRLVSVTSTGGKTLELDGKFTIGENSVCTQMEYWYPMFESFGGESAERPIRIAKPAHLLALATAVNEGTSYSGIYFKQTSDISLSEYSNWVGIGTASCMFSGVYNGNDKMVSGLSISADAPENNGSLSCGYALFRHVGGVDVDNKAEIKNLTVSGAVSGAAGSVGGVVARCSVFSTITGCINMASVSVSMTATGAGDSAGIVGQAIGGDITIEDCENRGDVTITAAAGVLANNCGGIVGSATGTTAESRVAITDCRNYAKIMLQGNSGGVLGSSNGYIDVLRCANYGDVIQSTKAATTVARLGGVAGSLGGDATVKESFNAGKVDGYRQTGSVVGFANGTCAIENCYNKGETLCQGTTGNTGAIIGNLNAATVVIKHCYNIGVFTLTPSTDTNGFGGIAGCAKTANHKGVSGCYYESGKGMIGGLGQGADKVAIDKPGQAEGKNASWFTSGIPVAEWDTSVWTFTAGNYPSLTGNKQRQ